MDYFSGRSSPKLESLRKSPTMEQAVQTHTSQAPVGRRSPVLTRPLPSVQHKPVDTHDSRKGKNGDDSCLQSEPNGCWVFAGCL